MVSLYMAKLASKERIDVHGISYMIYRYIDPIYQI